MLPVRSGKRGPATDPSSTKDRHSDAEIRSDQVRSAEIEIEPEECAKGERYETFLRGFPEVSDLSQQGEPVSQECGERPESKSKNDEVHKVNQRKLLSRVRME